MLDTTTIDAPARACHAAKRERIRIRAPGIAQSGCTAEAHLGDTFLVDCGPPGAIAARFVQKRLVRRAGS